MKTFRNIVIIMLLLIWGLPWFSLAQDAIFNKSELKQLEEAGQYEQDSKIMKQKAIELNAAFEDQQKNSKNNDSKINKLKQKALEEQTKAASAIEKSMIIRYRVYKEKITELKFREEDKNILHLAGLHENKAEESFYRARNLRKDGSDSEDNNFRTSKFKQALLLEQQSMGNLLRSLEYLTGQKLITDDSYSIDDQFAETDSISIDGIYANKSLSDEQISEPYIIYIDENTLQGDLDKMNSIINEELDQPNLVDGRDEMDSTNNSTNNFTNSNNFPKNSNLDSVNENQIDSFAVIAENESVISPQDNKTNSDINSLESKSKESNASSSKINSNYVEPTNQTLEPTSNHSPFQKESSHEKSSDKVLFENDLNTEQAKTIQRNSSDTKIEEIHSVKNKSNNGKESITPFLKTNDQNNDAEAHNVINKTAIETSSATSKSISGNEIIFPTKAVSKTKALPLNPNKLDKLNISPTQHVPDSDLKSNGRENHEDNEILYKVQIAASRRPLNVKELQAIYPDVEKISMDNEEGWYKYSISHTQQYHLAYQNLNQIQVNGAFITAYQNNKKLNLYYALRGKTVFSKNGDVPNVNLNGTNGISTGVQLIAVSKLLSDKKLKTIYHEGESVIVIKEDGLYKYRIPTSTIEKAQLMRLSCGVADAFVYLYVDGKKIYPLPQK